jgi:hypothetical protein
VGARSSLPRGAATRKALPRPATWTGVHVPRSHPRRPRLHRHPRPRHGSNTACCLAAAAAAPAAGHAAGASGGRDAKQGHAGCGHQLVADESRRWSEAHSRWRDALQALEAEAQEIVYLNPEVRPGSADAAASGVRGGGSSSAQQPRQQQLQDAEVLSNDAAVARGGGAPARRAPPRLLAEQAAASRPIRIFVEYQFTELEPEVKQKLQDTVSVTLGVLQKYLRVRRPAPAALLAPALCVIFDSAGYCNQYQPDYISPGGSNKKLSMCGLAKINGSHIAPYRQCSLGGASCSDYQGAWRPRLGTGRAQGGLKRRLKGSEAAAEVAARSTTHSLQRRAHSPRAAPAPIRRPPPGGTGEHTDYYLYITATQDNHCDSGAVSWALPCLYDTNTNRPLLVGGRAAGGQGPAGFAAAAIERPEPGRSQPAG